MTRHSAHSLVAALLALGSTTFGGNPASAQTFPQVVGSFQTTTTILSPIPASGLLLINYNFFSTPDTLDVYYGGTHLFDSGPVSGAGQFSIPYGPGAFSSLQLVMNQTPADSGSFWEYTPQIVPVPEPASLLWLVAGLSLLAVCRPWKRRAPLDEAGAAESYHPGRSCGARGATRQLPHRRGGRVAPRAPSSLPPRPTFGPRWHYLGAHPALGRSFSALRARDGP